jgi:hypothetical protein
VNVCRHSDTVVSAIADFVTLTGTDFKVDDARIEAEALQQAPGRKSKYLLNAIEENDSSGCVAPAPRSTLQCSVG